MVRSARSTDVCWSHAAMVQFAAMTGVAVSTPSMKCGTSGSCVRRRDPGRRQPRGRDCCSAARVQQPDRGLDLSARLVENES